MITFQQLNKHLNDHLNQQYLLHLKKQKNEIRNPYLNCMEIFWINLSKSEKNINTEIYKEYFKYQNLLFSGKILHITKQSRKKLIVDRLNNALILLKKSLTLINSKKVIAPTQVKASNTSVDLLNEICQIMHSLHRAKMYNNIMNSIKL